MTIGQRRCLLGSVLWLGIELHCPCQQFLFIFLLSLPLVCLFMRHKMPICLRFASISPWFLCLYLAFLPYFVCMHPFHGILDSFLII